MSLISLLRQGKRFGRKTLLLGLTGMMLYAGCSKEPNILEPGEIQTGTSLSQNTKILTDISLDKLSFYSDGKFVFYETTNETDKIVTGDIVVGGISKNTPKGFLRKVTGISNDKKTISTTLADLEKTIKTGSFETRKRFLPTGTFKSIPGVFQKPASSKDFNFNVGIEEAVLYDADGNSRTTDDQVKMNGSTSFNYEMYFNFRIENFVLQKIVFENNVNNSTILKVEANDLIKKIDKKIEIAKYELPPFTILLPSLPLPIVFTPEIAVSVGVKGDVSDSVTMEITDDANLLAGISYENSEWKAYNTFSNDFQFEIPVVLNTDIKGFGGPELKLSIYEVAGISADINAFGRLDADIHRTPSWKLFGGLEVLAGAYADIFGKKIADYSAKVIDFEKLLAEAKSDNVDAGKKIYMHDDGTDEKTLSWMHLDTMIPVLLYNDEKGKTWGWYAYGGTSAIQNPVTDNKYGFCVLFRNSSLTKIKIQKIKFYLKAPSNYSGDPLKDGFYLHVWDSKNNSLTPNNYFIPRNEIKYGWWEKDISNLNISVNPEGEFKAGLCQIFFPKNEPPNRPTFLGADENSSGNSYIMINGKLQKYNYPHEFMIRAEVKEE